MTTSETLSTLTNSDKAVALTTLHIVSAVLDTNQQSQLLAAVCEQTSVIFMTDGVYLLHDKAFIDELCKQSPHQLTAITEDCTARAIPLNNPVVPIEYDTFVALTLAHKNSLTW